MFMQLLQLLRNLPLDNLDSMEINKLNKTTEKKLRRLGQGLGSGRGKTAGRGTKGQKARGKVKRFFEGGALPLTKRLPFLRGRGRNAAVSVAKIGINVGLLNNLPAKSDVNVELLVKEKIVDAKAKRIGVKILGEGELKKVLSVNLPVTAGARKKIEAAGGTVL